MTDAASAPSQRLDRWLWFARFFKSRSLAAKACRDGGVRVNREIERKPSHLVRPGDLLSFRQGHGVRVVRMIAPGVRRGPAGEAQALYEDLAPPNEAPAAQRTAARRRGAGRPTKAERRALDALRGRGEGGDI